MRYLCTTRIIATNFQSIHNPPLPSHTLIPSSAPPPNTHSHTPRIAYAAMDEFEAYLFQAEGAAYQSMFIEHSSAKGTPESMLKTARADVTSMRKFMSVLAKQLNVEELKVDSLPMVVAGGGGVEVRGRSRGT